MSFHCYRRSHNHVDVYLINHADVKWWNFNRTHKRQKIVADFEIPNLIDKVQRWTFSNAMQLKLWIWFSIFILGYLLSFQVKRNVVAQQQQQKPPRFFASNIFIALYWKCWAHQNCGSFFSLLAKHRKTNEETENRNILQLCAVSKIPKKKHR